MTEMQPTEIELTGKPKKEHSHSKRKIFAWVSIIVVILVIMLITIFMANRASISPDLVEPGALPTRSNQ